MPIMRGGLGIMVVQGHLDVVFVGHPFDHVERLDRRFGHEGLDAEFASELEHAPTADFVAGDLLQVIGEEPYAGVVEL